MNKIRFVEGVPGVGKTSFIHGYVNAQNPDNYICIVKSDDVVPLNMVRREVINGRSLSLQQAREIYASKPYCVYLNEHLEIWQRFCEENNSCDNDIIVDGGLFQAPLYDLMGLYMMDNKNILIHIQRILDLIRDYFSFELVYIRAEHPSLCIRSAIENQWEQRSQWYQGFCRWLEVAPYPVSKGYSGLSGIEKYIEDRYRTDCCLLENLDIPIIVYNREEL